MEPRKVQKNHKALEVIPRQAGHRLHHQAQEGEAGKRIMKSKNSLLEREKIRKLQGRERDLQEIRTVPLMEEAPAARVIQEMTEIIDGAAPEGGSENLE